MKIGEGVNEHGTKISLHTCDICSQSYTIVPAVNDKSKGWESCQAETCPSYDPKRDADILFMSEEELSKKKVVSLKMLKARNNIKLQIEKKGD